MPIAAPAPDEPAEPVSTQSTDDEMAELEALAM